MTAELMRQVDLVVATGSQTNVRAAYASGTPAIADPLLAALSAAGGVVLDEGEARQLERAMFAAGRLGSTFIAQDAPAIALRAGLACRALLDARFLIVAETGVGAAHPFSGEKLSPVLTFYR